MVTLTSKSKRWFALTALAVASVTLTTLAALPSPAAEEKNELAMLMRKKLDASSQILEGLTVKDASLIRKGAGSLLRMSKAEMFNILTDAEYREFNGEFRTALRKLDQAAEAENFDNAFLQWFDAVKGCVECHTFVRDQHARIKTN